jgi:L-lactate permease
MTTVHAFQAFLEGVALACWPILLVIIAAIFTYNLSEHTKGMDGIKKMLTSVSNDRRVLILLIGWVIVCFCCLVLVLVVWFCWIAGVDRVIWVA